MMRGDSFSHDVNATFVPSGETDGNEEMVP